MKIAKQGYVTFNADGAFAPAASASEQGQASTPEAGVAYRLSRIAEEAAAEGALAPNAVERGRFVGIQRRSLGRRECVLPGQR